MKKRILSILLAVCLVVTMFPVTALSLGEDSADLAEQPTVQYTVLEGSGGFSGEGHENLFDGDTATKWCANMSGTLYVIFKTDSPVFVSGFDIITANDNADSNGRNPKNWTLYGCNDYVPGSVQESTTKGDEDTTYWDDESTTYWGDEDTTYWGDETTTSGDEDTTYWDDESTTYWGDENTTYWYDESTTYSSIAREFAVSANSESSSSTDEENTTSNYGDSGSSASWTPIYAVTDDTVLQDKNFTKYSYVFEKETTAYQYYKLEITKTQGAGVMQMSEFALTFCDHVWEETGVPATCTEDGYTEKACTVCNNSIQTIFPKLGHDFSAGTGSCDRCGWEMNYVFDISQGRIIITSDENNPGKIKIKFGSQIMVNVDPAMVLTVTGSTTTNELNINTDIPVTIKAQDLTIDRTGQNYTYALSVGGVDSRGQVTLILEGTNTLKAGYEKAGVNVGEGRTLIIEGNGSLNAVGGDYGAGIGAERRNTCGTVIINSGTVTATGKDGGAGIGGGGKYSGVSGGGGTVIINGGTVTANGNNGGSDIGGGQNNTNGVCILLGGTVTATNGNFGTGSGIKVNEDGTLEVYGDLTLPADITIPEGKTLVIPAGVTLTVPDGVTLTNNGTIINNNGFTNNGTVINNGTFINNGNLEEINHNYTNGFCICGEYEPAELTDGVYQIKNAGNLCWFAKYVNANRENTYANAVLTNDIDFGSRNFIAIGTSSYAYQGTFDGCGYKITVNQSGSNDVAIFGYVKNGTIKNLTVTGVIETADKYAAGFIMHVPAGGEVPTTLENCVSDVTINSTVSGDGTHGGFVGIADGKVIINNCAFTGAINGSETFNCAGVVGWTQSVTTVSNCYISATFGVNTAGGNIVSRVSSGKITVTNFYYLNPLGSAPSSGVTQATEAQFTSGEVAYLLNSGVTDGTQKWYQTLGTDSVPTLNNTHGTVYHNLRYPGCVNNPGEPSDVYANTSETIYADHNYENGFCTMCDGYEPAELTDGVYQIKNAGNLYWFSALVNGTLKDSTEQNTSADAVLVNDIIVNTSIMNEDGVFGGKVWMPIGESTNRYTGNFDGQNHTVSGLFFNDTSANNIGLFGSIGTNGKVSNVGVVDSFFVGGARVGGICGAKYGTVENCYNTSTINGTDFVGGICGNNYGGAVQNCYNTGAVIGMGNYIGGICGILNKGTIENCYNIGLLSSSESSYVGNICGFVGSNGTISNCYFDTDKCDENAVGLNSGKVTKTESKTAEEFASGEIAYILNNSVSNGTQSWYQTLGTDDYPTLDNTHGTVYCNVTYSGCIGNPGEPVSSAYENTEKSYYADHAYENGFCTVCGSYAPAELIDGVYQIKNAGNLYWFAALVGGTLTDGTARNSSANAVLVNDITVNTGVLKADGALADDTSGFKAWTPIGNSSSTGYAGTFDGQNHTVSGLYFNDSKGDFVGLFGYIDTSGKISNVGVVDSYFRGSLRIGGICGRKDGTVENCYSASTVSGSNLVGGVCGDNSGSSNLINCYNKGAVIGTSYYIGGVCGILNNGKMENCYSTGTVGGSSNPTIGGVCGVNHDTISNCYFDSSKCDKNAVGTNNKTLEKTEGKTAEQFASGEVAYLLAGGATDGTQKWYQTIGTDASPVLDNTHGTVYCNATYPGCVGNPGEPENAEYSNTEKENVYADHVYENDGFCTICGSFEPAELIDGVYQIKSAGNLYWFAALVNGKLTDGTEQNLSANAVLVNDITVNTGVLKADGALADDTSGFKAWTPIGNSSSTGYAGTFDGQNHTVSGLYFNDSSANNVGLIGYMGTSGKISNVGVVDSYFCGSNRVGGICGAKYGTMENCYSASTVSGTTAVGGVCGNNYNGNLLNCYNTGAVIGTGNYIGGICGILNIGTIQNCYSIGTVGGSSSSSVGGVCGINFGTISNCYFDSSKCDKNAVGSNNATYISTEGKTTEQFASGEVAYLLAGGATDGSQKWYQTIGTDSAPVLNNTHGTVYYGYSDCAGSAYTYANVPLSDTIGHSVVNGFCTMCGEYEPAELLDGVYQIKNAGNLYWFAALVGGTLTDGMGQNLSANAVLVNDITVNTGVLKADGSLADDTSGFKAWTPIGNSSIEYAGTFDGQNHTVSGLYFNDSSVDFVGLFGAIGSSGKISNVGVVDSYFCGNKWVGGVCGSKYGTVENCYNASTVSGFSSVGGVCGNNYNGKLLNCYNTGAVIGTRWYIGGVCGIVNSGTIQNCYSTGTVGGSSDVSVGGVCGYNGGTISNCYFDSSKYDKNAVGINNKTVEKTEGKTTEGFASGEVAYLLNSGVSDGTQKWYQTLGEDSTPTLDNTCGTVYGGYAYCGSSERLYANAPILFETRPGHSYTDGVCDICGAEKSIVIIEDDMHAEGFVVGANTVSDCKAELNTAEMYVEIKNINGDALADADLVGTGATITYYDSTTNAAVKTVTVVLYGDVDGDGRINAADKDTVMLKAVGAAEIENAWFSIAADANRDGVVDAFDAALINLQAANSYPISQKIG